VDHIVLAVLLQAGSQVSYRDLLLTKCMKHNPSREANSRSSSQ